MMHLREMMQKMSKSLHSFARCENGMTLPLLAISMVAITGMVGMAIDTARAQLVASKLQFSLDAAGLAAGSTVNTQALNEEVNKYLGVNFNGYLGAVLTGTQATVDKTNTIITISATATLPTTFLNVVGLKTITLTANSQISRAVTGLELVLVLDNTGSMNNSAGGGVSKIQALQTAANSLVSTLFAGNPQAGKLWVGIVPFSQSVNIGTSHPTWLNTTYDATITNMPLATGPGWGPTSWGGCVDARLNGEDVLDDPPTTGNTLFEQYYWTSDNLNKDGVQNGGQNKWATPVLNKQGKVTSYTYASPLNTTHQGPNLLCPQQVTPMTNVQQTLTTAINAMTAQGDTLLNQGVIWGWNMISPRWQGYWGGSMNANGLPLAYNTQGMQKAVVILTDGENTVDNSNHGGYWFLGDARLGTTNSTTAITNLNNKTLSVCNAMKTNGIYIYTIALGTDTTPDSLALLASCATAPNYYFNSPSTSTLSGVFSAIGDSLSNLRVSK